MDEEQRRLEHYKLIFAHFNRMEHRYHTWMNYYSLFNGALLVAYCTILVSMGKIVEMEGNISNNGFTNLGAKLFYLNCTYWDILAIIAILGVIASYCWYLSMIGHRSWIKSWKRILDDEGMDFDKLVYVPFPGGRFFTHFHSTYRVTVFFIYTVLLAWILVAGYSYGNHKITWNLFVFCFSVSIILVVLEYFLHFIFGSDLGDHSRSTLSLGYIDRMCLALPARTCKKYSRCILWKLIILIVAAILAYNWIPSKPYDISHELKLKHKTHYKTIEIIPCDTIEKNKQVKFEIKTD